MGRSHLCREPPATVVWAVCGAQACVSECGHLTTDWGWSCHMSSLPRVVDTRPVVPSVAHSTSKKWEVTGQQCSQCCRRVAWSFVVSFLTAHLRQPESWISCVVYTYCTTWGAVCRMLANRSGVYHRGLMMMPFICSCRTKNSSKAIYPLGTFHHKEKKQTHVMMLSPWPHNGAMVILFSISVKLVRYWDPTCYPPSASIDQWFVLMSHSISYNNVSHTRLCVMTMTLTSPPLLPLWTGWSMQWLTQSHLLMWGLLVPTSMSLLILPVSLETVPGYIQKFDPWVPPSV